jgi:hypothetical protein
MSPGKNQWKRQSNFKLMSAEGIEERKARRGKMLPNYCSRQAEMNMRLRGEIIIIMLC